MCFVIWLAFVWQGALNSELKKFLKGKRSEGEHCISCEFDFLPDNRNIADDRARKSTDDPVSCASGLMGICIMNDFPDIVYPIIPINAKISSGFIGNSCLVPRLQAKIKEQPPFFNFIKEIFTNNKPGYSLLSGESDTYLLISLFS
jgi:hypothetical protein